MNAKVRTIQVFKYLLSFEELKRLLWLQEIPLQQLLKKGHCHQVGIGD